MKTKLLITLITLLPLNAHSEAWTIAKGQTHLRNNIIYSNYKNIENYVHTHHNDTLTSNIEAKQDITYGANIEYGLSDKLTLSAKGSSSLKPLKLSQEIQGTNNAKTVGKFSAMQIEGNFGGRLKIAHNDRKVLSLSYNYYPGQIINYKAQRIYTDILAAHELKLMHGISYRYSTNQELYNFFEYQIGVKHFYRIRQAAVNFKIAHGFKLSTPATLITELELGINGFSKNLSEYEPTLLFAVPKDARSSIKKYNPYNSHKISFKYSYDLGKSKSLALESYHNILSKKPFSENALLVGITKKF